MKHLRIVFVAVVFVLCGAWSNECLAGTYAFVPSYGDGKLNITIKANILNKDGTAFPQGGITDARYGFSKNATTGKVDINMNGNDLANEHPDANGDYSKQLPAGIMNAIRLPKREYKIEFDLRILATAPTAQGQNNQAHRAEVEKVKATIELK